MATLNPLVVLRYSATHAEKFNLVHRLGPKTATEQGLVKRVSVKGVVPETRGRRTFGLTSCAPRTRRLFAEVMLDVDGADGPKRTREVLQNGDDLYDKSKGLDQYRGWSLPASSASPTGSSSRTDETVRVGEEIGVDRMAIWQDQIRHTIRAHLQRQAQIDATGRDVKVLSLSSSSTSLTIGPSRVSLRRCYPRCSTSCTAKSGCVAGHDAARVP